MCLDKEEILIKMKTFLLIVLQCCLFISFAQKQADHWQFGTGVGLQFNGNASPTVVTGAITSTLGSSAIANNNGNLLFYTDGSVVYNQFHLTMPNGTGLSGVNSDQSLILKQPGNSNLYFVFTVSSGPSLPGLRYSVIDMNLASGTGSVITKNMALYTGTVSSKIAAARHCNGTDYWILVCVANSVQAYSLTSVGTGSLPVVSTFTNAYLGTTRGQLKVSPNGKRIGITSMDYNATQNLASNQSVWLGEFDNLSGIASNLQSYFVGTNLCVSGGGCQVYGQEFSADGTKFYYWNTQLGLVQVDLCSGINGTYFPVPGINENPNTVGLLPKRSLQLAPDKKIYLINAISTNTANTTSNTNTLGIIANPNLSYSLCNYNPFALALSNYTLGWGLPNFPGFYFEQKPNPFFTYTANPSACNNVSFTPGQVCPSGGYTVTGYFWNFGDPLSASQNTSSLSNPTHSYPSTGTYSVSMIRYFAGCTFQSDTIRQLIQITSPTLSVAQSPFPCGVNTATAITGNGIGPYIYTWQPGNYTTTVANFTAAGIYSLSMIDQGGGCAKQITVQINNVVLSPTVNIQPPSCFGYTNGSASISISGGSGTYSLYWSNNQINVPLCTSLSAGNASVLIVDPANQCTTSSSFTIAQPPLLTVSLSANNNNACPGQTIVLSPLAIGGTQPYTFNWYGTNSMVPTSVSFSPGVYTPSVVVVDANGCQTAPSVITLTFFPNPALVTHSAVICAGTSTVLSATGASNYTWQPSGVTSTQLSVSPVSNSIYTVIAESNNCLVTQTVLVQVLSNPTFSLHANNPLCQGGNLSLSASGSYSYLWMGPSGFVSSQQNPFINNVTTQSSGTYSSTATDANGCNHTNTLAVIINASPLISVSGLNEICLGQSLTLTALGAVSYTWSNNVLQNPLFITPSTNTVMSVTGINNLGCSNTFSFNISLQTCLGFQAKNDEKDILFYPNPNHGSFNIGLKTEGYITILNMLGQLIFETRVIPPLNSITVPDIKPGTYCVVLKQGDNTTLHKLLVQ